MQESNFTIENDILHFVYKGSDMLIDLTQLETMSLYQNLVVFVDNGKVKSFPHSCFDLRELTFQLMDNPNFMVCGRRLVVNMNLVKSIYIERDKDSIVERYEDGLGISDKHNVVLTFVNERREYIRTNSWREAERLYHDIDEKLTDLRNAQIV